MRFHYFTNKCRTVINLTCWDLPGSHMQLEIVTFVLRSWPVAFEWA